MEVVMCRNAKSFFNSVGAVALAVTFAALFAGSVLGVEGRLPKRLLPEAVTLAVTSPVSPLPALHPRR
jgi:hypothetical protein